MLLFNAGDSHTSYEVGHWCPKVEDHYWYKIAMQDFHCDGYINDSSPGRSNDRIIKSVMSHCLENPNLETLYIINITTIFRIDLTFAKSHTLHNILTDAAISEIEFETIECTLYTQLIGLIEFLKARNKKFLVVNNAKNFSDDPLPHRDPYVNYVKQEPRILNWFDNARINFQETVTGIKPVDFEKYSWNGHDGPAGHLKYYQMLRTRLTNI